MKSEKQMSEWKTYKLGEIAQIIGGGTPSTNVEEYWNGEIGWLTPRDLTGYTNKFISNGERNITEIGLKNSSARLMPKGTVLMTSRAPIGYIAIASNELCTNQGFKSFVVDEKKINNEFLYYSLKDNIDKIKSLGTGSTFAEVSGSILKNFEITAPDLPTQTAIAQILTSLDDKIELNLQMNQTLEAMAQALFKEWFVNFNFPGNETEKRKVKSEKSPQSVNQKNDVLSLPKDHSADNLPKGWRMGSVLEIATLLSGGTPKTDTEEYWNGSINWISAKDITSSNNQFIIETEKTITELGIKKSAAKLLPKFTTIISARGTVGNYCILSKEMAISQSNYGLKSNSNKDYFLFLMVENMILMMKAFSYGTVFDTITTKTFQEMEVTIPDEKVIMEFETVITPLYEKILTNQFQIQALTQTRDTLLPKLMSGKIPVEQ